MRLPFMAIKILFNALMYIWDVVDLSHYFFSFISGSVRILVLYLITSISFFSTSFTSIIFWQFLRANLGVQSFNQSFTIISAISLLAVIMCKWGLYVFFNWIKITF